MQASALPASTEPPPWGTCGVSEFRLKRRWRRHAPDDGGAVEPAYIERTFRYSAVERREADLAWATTTATTTTEDEEEDGRRERWDPLFQRPTRRPRPTAAPIGAVAAVAAWAPRASADADGGNVGVEVFASDDEGGSVAGGDSHPPPPPPQGSGGVALLSYSMDFFGGSVGPTAPTPAAAGATRGGSPAAGDVDGSPAFVVEERAVEVFGSDDEDDEEMPGGSGQDAPADAATAAAAATATAADAALAAERAVQVSLRTKRTPR